MVNRLIVLLVKDILVSVRRGHEILASIGFVAAASLAASLFSYRSIIPHFVIPSLWLFIIFISIFISMVTFVSEYERYTLIGLRLLPLSPSLLYLEKTVYTFILTFGEGLLSLILLSIFSASSILLRLSVLITMVLFTLYISSVSSFTSLLVMYSEGRSFLIPILIFILSAPLLGPIVSISMPMLPASWFDYVMLAVGSASFLIMAMVLSEFILEV